MGTVRVNYNHLSWRNFNDLFDTGAMLPEIRGHEAIGDALSINARLACQNFCHLDGARTNDHALGFNGIVARNHARRIAIYGGKAPVRIVGDDNEPTPIIPRDIVNMFGRAP